MLKRIFPSVAAIFCLASFSFAAELSPIKLLTARSEGREIPDAIFAGEKNFPVIQY